MPCKDKDLIKKELKKARNTVKFKRCVAKVERKLKRKGKKGSPYAICKVSLRRTLR